MCLNQVCVDRQSLYVPLILSNKFILFLTMLELFIYLVVYTPISEEHKIYDT